MRARRAGLALVGLIAVVGATLALAYARTSLLASPAEAAPGLTVGVERHTLRDSLTLRGTLAYDDRGVVRAAAPGRATALGVTTGSPVVSGTVLLAIDGRPMVAVIGAQPFWRSLAMSDVGPDVRELNDVLRSAGLPAPEDDQFTAQTAAALRRWQTLHGAPADGRLELNDLAVITDPARVGAVTIAVGEFVAPGSALLRLQGSQAHVALAVTPTDRTRISQGQSALIQLATSNEQLPATVSAVDESPTLSAQGAQSYGATITPASALAGRDGTPVSAVIVISEARDVLCVPLAAVISDGTGQPAVRVREARGTRIVAIRTGISEGAYVEVTGGLSGTESVLLGTGL